MKISSQEQIINELHKFNTRLQDKDSAFFHLQDDHFVAIPMGHAVELQITIDKSHPYGSDWQFNLTVMAWDRTGGISREDYIGSAISPSLTESLVRAFLKERDEEDAELDRLLSPLSDEGSVSRELS